MLKYLASLVLIFAACTASAGSAPDRWIEVRSPHFLVLSNSSEKNARNIASQLEQMRSIFHTLFPTAADDTDAPITVFALKDKKSFKSLEPASYLAKGQLDLAGYFLRTSDKNYILLRLDAEGEHPFAIVYHEYTHYMLRKADGWLPLWLSEGLAQFYQNTEIEGNDVRLGSPNAEDILLLRQNRLLPVTTLMQVDSSSPYYREEDKGTIFYAESWALTHYLMLNDSDHKTHRLQQYVDVLSQGQDSVTAAENAFGDLKKLDKTLNGYVQQGSFELYKMNYTNTVDESSFQVQPVSVDDVNAVRADVLVDNERTQEAQALLTTVLYDDPNNALAHETMGFLMLRAGDPSSAQKWFSQAVQLNSTSCLAHYYFAILSEKNADQTQDAAIESSLRTAIHLDPSFAPAYDALAMFYATRHENLDEAHVLNLHAVELDPKNLNYRLNAAAVLADNRKYTDALSVLEMARPLAQAPSEVARLQNRIQNIESDQGLVARKQTVAGEVTARGAATPRTVRNTFVVSGTESTPSPKYPTEPPTGLHHKVRGILRSVQCSYPSVMTLSLEEPGKTIVLYSNNYFRVDFTAANFTPQGKMDPCTAIGGIKALVEYAEVSDKHVAGQILSVELAK